MFPFLSIYFLLPPLYARALARQGELAAMSTVEGSPLWVATIILERFSTDLMAWMTNGMASENK